MWFIPFFYLWCFFWSFGGWLWDDKDFRFWLDRIFWWSGYVLCMYYVLCAVLTLKRIGVIFIQILQYLFMHMLAYNNNHKLINMLGMNINILQLVFQKRVQFTTQPNVQSTGMSSWTTSDYKRKGWDERRLSEHRPGGINSKFVTGIILQLNKKPTMQIFLVQVMRKFASTREHRSWYIQNVWKLCYN